MCRRIIFGFLQLAIALSMVVGCGDNPNASVGGSSPDPASAADPTLAQPTREPTGQINFGPAGGEGAPAGDPSAESQEGS